MAAIPIFPRILLHLLNAFIAIALVLIIFFPTLSYTRSVYSPTEESSAIITDAIAGDNASPSALLQVKLPEDQNDFEPLPTVHARQIDPSSPATALHLIRSTLYVIWRSVIIMGHFMWFALFPLQAITVFLFNQLLFLLQPFFIMGVGLYTLVVLWPVQFINYLAKTFYPLYVFLACASIIGLFIGGVASLTTTFLNNAAFPRQISKPVTSRRSPLKTSESPPGSVVSSGAVTPTSLHRAPPPSKFPSSTSANEDVHILDMNALFSSFSLPPPPHTPPGILYSAPTPAGSISGLLGDTIFEEEDDSDEKVSVAPTFVQQSWGVGGGKPLTRPESAHGRLVGRNEGSSGMGTWHGRVKREDVAADQGIDWGSNEVRRRKATLAVK